MKPKNAMPRTNADSIFQCWTIGTSLIHGGNLDDDKSGFLREESFGHRTSILGRQGGDEFVILLPGVEAEEAVTIAEGLREVCEARALVDQDPATKFTISIGAATDAKGAAELGAVLRRADATLHRAKRAGGNQVGQTRLRNTRCLANLAGWDPAHS